MTKHGAILAIIGGLTLVGLALFYAAYEDYALLHDVLPNFWLSAFSPIWSISSGCLWISLAVFAALKQKD